MTMKIVPFSRDYVEEAAALVATRYQAERGINPLLPVQFEASSAILPRLQDVDIPVNSWTRRMMMKLTCSKPPASPGYSLKKGELYAVYP